MTDGAITLPSPDPTYPGLPESQELKESRLQGSPPAGLQLLFNCILLLELLYHNNLLIYDFVCIKKKLTHAFFFSDHYFVITPSKPIYSEMYVSS